MINDINNVIVPNSKFILSKVIFLNLKTLNLTIFNS